MIGKTYLEGKLQISGKVPVPAPSEVSKKSRQQVSSLLSAPLKRLTITDEGALVLPVSPQAYRQLPFQVTEVISTFLEGLSEEFSQEEETTPAVGVGGTTGANGSSPGTVDSGSGGPTSGSYEPGTLVGGREVILGSSWIIMKEAPCLTDGWQLLLGKHAPSGNKQVFLENARKAQRSLPGETYIGQGGLGSFKSADGAAPPVPRTGHTPPSMPTHL